MNLYYLFAALIFFATILSYVNGKYIKWPGPIAVMFFSLSLSALLLTLQQIFPALTKTVQNAISSINFYDLLMNIFLGFILFAGAFKVDIAELKKQIKPVLTLAIVSTFISTLMVGYLVFFSFQLFDIDMPLLHCLLFGSLISPTDPVAVLGILQKMGIPASVEMKITGESLFNDGIAIVFFTAIYEAVAKGESLNFSDAALLFVTEAGGGVLLGLVMAGLGYYSLKSTSEYKVEILITLVIVLVGYSIANFIHVSGPLAMVIAGLVTGSITKHHGMSESSQKYVSAFWELLEDFLNMILFLLIGLEVLVIPHHPSFYYIGAIAIIVVLLARYVSVFIPSRFVKSWFAKAPVPLLVWCGMRGGVSIALALSLMPEMHRSFFVVVTYIVATFSIVVQGLTIKGLVKKLDLTANP